MMETAGKNILVDPGNLLYEPGFANDWSKADFILITHKHADHCHAEVIKNIDAPIYSSAEVAAAYPDLKIKIVKAGDELSLSDGIDAEVATAVHGYIPWLKGDKEIRENIGYIVRAEGKNIYFTSDTICFKNDYKCDILCAPVSSHGLVMSPFEVALFTKECGAELVLPCHMDNPKFPADIEKMAETFASHEISYRVLKTKETICL
jgi:L-ascorbate metabolism protein UlaG (beta-lactamase superfamily)